MGFDMCRPSELIFVADEMAGRLRLLLHSSEDGVPGDPAWRRVCLKRQ
jgi:hypothetical protein